MLNSTEKWNSLSCKLNLTHYSQAIFKFHSWKIEDNSNMDWISWKIGLYKSDRVWIPEMQMFLSSTLVSYNVRTWSERTFLFLPDSVEIRYVSIQKTFDANIPIKLYTYFKACISFPRNFTLPHTYVYSRGNVVIFVGENDEKK